MQQTTGTLSPGGHPGSYNGQDAYNDMLVVDDGLHGDGNRAGECRNYEGGCPTLNCTSEQPILCSSTKVDEHSGISTDGVGTTLQAREDERPMVAKTNVRRLTPGECALLQGFPADWCDIGDWVDENGKTHKEADSPKYKALGNSICTPFWFWLLRRISAQYERPATLGSLFDGIGGFPYCWARCNGSKYVLWASEIEQFPIAVVKKHFGDEDAGIEGDIGKYL